MKHGFLGMAVVFMCVLNGTAQIRADDVVIQNHSQQTFYYALRSNDGKDWSKTYEIGPGEQQSHAATSRLRISYLTESAQFAWLDAAKTYRIEDVEQGQLRAVTQVRRPTLPEPASDAAERADASAANGETPDATSDASGGSDAASEVSPAVGDDARTVSGPDAAQSNPTDSTTTAETPAPSLPSAVAGTPADDGTPAEETFEGLFDIANRLVTVRAIADKTYRQSFPNWRERMRDIVAGASNYYQREFSIRLVLSKTAEWEYSAVHDDLETRWSRLLEQSPGDADLIIALVGYGDYSSVEGSAAYTGQLGRAAFFGQHLMVADRKDFHVNRAKTILIHELGHIFGAFHVDDQNLLMYPGYLQLPTENIIAGTVPFGDAFNKVFAVTKGFDFKAGVAGLSAAAQQEIQNLYRQHGLAGESRQTDPVTAGYKYLERRAKIVAEQMSKRADAARGAFDGLPE